MTQNEPGGIVTPTAQTQQILGQALRQIKFAAERVIGRLPIWNLKELRGGTQLLPHRPCRALAWPVSGAAKPFTSSKTAPRELRISSSCR